MSPVVHALIAWLIAIMVLKRTGDRRLAVICGFISDIDGFYLLYDTHRFYQYHHTWGHSFLFIVPLALVLCFFLAERKGRTFVASMLTFTAHLICDIVGSNWPVTPLYPLSVWLVPQRPLMSDEMIYLVVNPLVAAGVALLVLLVMDRKELTPFEFFSQKWDRRISALLAAPLRYRCAECDKRAFSRCEGCGKHLCVRHVQGRGWFGLVCEGCDKHRTRV